MESLKKPQLKLNFSSLVIIYRALVVFFVMILLGVSGNLLRFIFGARAITFNNTFLSKFAGWFILRLIGIKVKNLPSRTDFPSEQTIFIFNHNSFLDIFLIVVMGIPNCRYTINEETNTLLPLYWVNLANGALLVGRKGNPKKRLQSFSRLKNFISTSGKNIIASAEGQHKFGHYVDKFNHEVFQVALETKTPITPIFFKIPRAQNPFQGFSFRSGDIEIELLETIQTHDWNIDFLEKHISDVRKIFTEKFKQAHLET